MPFLDYWISLTPWSTGCATLLLPLVTGGFASFTVHVRCPAASSKDPRSNPETQIAHYAYRPATPHVLSAVDSYSLYLSLPG
ncbi:uncharacterized protein BDR25DRAFT_68072 [Lindgomyces ingoldianus]|uniref:Uncharacterized protein n=1 Tax=Lindgomyces ingoldianus TaxID=673940 RepID=A0ACB6RC39_9PLEO|nr:uncharacterized protein BDR25DRAFT_68072 [Lindgomyces ingoldianus]KAF2476657.1 hypothetical protein BDR25DRAFT_68072 [Lindgomyces ingoldianus]